MRFSVSALLPLCRRLATLKQNRDAAVLIEYALVAPPFLALLIAILNTAMIYVAQEGLETAAESAARIMMTGQAQTMTLANGHVGMTAADFKSAICSGFTGTDSSGNSVTYAAMLPPMLSCSNLTVNVQTATAYNASNIVAPTFTYDSNGLITSTGTGYTTLSNGSGQNLIVMLQLIYLWPTTVGPLGFNLADQPNRKRMIVATSVFTTESYSCSSSQTSC